MINQLKAQQDKLLISERHEAWEHVARKLAHEIKNPLTPIQLIIDSLKSKKRSIEKEMAFTCGSGVTVCILGLANSIISGNKPIIYDGSWAEYGLD